MFNRITINFHTDNAAFEDNPNELASILQSIANKVKEDPDYHKYQNVKDSNGNIIGTFKIYNAE